MKPIIPLGFDIHVACDKISNIRLAPNCITLSFPSPVRLKMDTFINDSIYSTFLTSRKQVDNVKMYDDYKKSFTGRSVRRNDRPPIVSSSNCFSKYCHRYGANKYEKHHFTLSKSFEVKYKSSLETDVEHFY